MKFTSHPHLSTEHRQQAVRWFAENAPAGVNNAAYLELLLQLAAPITAATGERPVTVSIAGSQGSGKSTLAGLLGGLIESVFDVSIAALSLDDFYLTRAEREGLAEAVHPLLRVRGVPGTHDVALMQSVLERLRSGQAVDMPVFDKASDDRALAGRHVPPADIILCEGWCWGAVPQTDAQLSDSLNSLEAEEDPAMIWRRYVNDALLRYQRVFQSDAFFYLRVPNMEAVYRWRWQQEQELRQSGREGAGLMDEAGVRRFVAYYERITRWMLDECPSRADVLVTLDDDHRVAGIGYAGDR